MAGMDAQVAYAFHSERENHPDKFKNQLTNQVLTTFLNIIPKFIFFTIALCLHISHMQLSNVTCNEGSDANFTYISDTMICMTTASVCQDYVQARLVLCRLDPSCLQVHTESQSSMFLKQLAFLMKFLCHQSIHLSW